jgi:hypothetical protein
MRRSKHSEGMFSTEVTAESESNSSGWEKLKIASGNVCRFKGAQTRSWVHQRGVG